MENIGNRDLFNPFPIMDYVHHPIFAIGNQKLKKSSLPLKIAETLL